MLWLDSGSHDPFYNLALEEHLFQTVREDEVFFLWRNTPCVVVGSFQSICREVRAAELYHLGIPVLRRMSGGGTVYHDLGNVNYTIIKDAPPGGEVCYGDFLDSVVAALNRLQIPARRGRTCDITLAGRKISGSAQRFSSGRVLHHGTLLFQADLERVDRLTAGGQREDIQSRGTPSAICSVTNIADHLTAPMAIETFEQRLLEAVLPPGSRMLALTAQQQAEVCRLRDEKYKSWAWTWGKDPAFTCCREGRLGDAPIRLAYRARHGIFSGVEVHCPLLDEAEAVRLLEGARLDLPELSGVCRRLAGGLGGELLELLL